MSHKGGMSLLFLSISLSASRTRQNISNNAGNLLIIALGLRRPFGQIFFIPLPSYQQLTIHFALLDFASVDGASAPRRLDSSAPLSRGRPQYTRSPPPSPYTTSDYDSPPPNRHLIRYTCFLPDFPTMSNPQPQVSYPMHSRSRPCQRLFILHDSH